MYIQTIKNVKKISADFSLTERQNGINIDIYNSISGSLNYGEIWWKPHGE